MTCRLFLRIEHVLWHEIELLGPDACVRGGWRPTMPDGSKPGGLFTLIFCKFPEGWKIVHDHASAKETSNHTEE